ncbi:hypothetical protein ASZ90_015725 [hydrocarbon metagenome]|uniref:Uncharacterized protein n=1 Tax=hydrocarbon metagenome TaxID=938273 RepID=A0A0W8F195_9ZZZZ
MRAPDEELRERLRRDRIWFVRRSAAWVRAVPNEVWSKRQCEFINSLFLNRSGFPLTRDQYIRMIDASRSASGRRKGSPRMPDLRKYGQVP